MKTIAAFFVGCLILTSCDDAKTEKYDLGKFAAKGDVASLRKALAAGAKINAVDSAGYSPLALAAFNGRSQAVKALLELGADPQAGFAPLRALPLAASQGNLDIVKLLLASGALAEYPKGQDQPLAYASDPEVVRMLLEKGAHLNLPSGSEKGTCLLNAAALGRADTVKKLLEWGADPKQSNSNGWTPLHMVCRLRSIDLLPGGAESVRQILRMLLAAKADPNALDQNLNTPLHFAARNPALRPSDIEELIRAGAKRNLENGFGRTPLMVAQLNGLQTDKARLAVLAERSSPNRSK